MMDEDKLEYKLGKVCDADSFIEFLKALHDDKVMSEVQEKTTPSSPYESNANGWENTNLIHFFEAAVAWSKTTVADSIISDATAKDAWLSAAHIIYAGKIYE
ncbi:hypothetical protein F9L33_13110 [Amylibacter sp. SFDW26]|uniref:DUF7660 family protein n=1 Tax=Amylibacter sp. SFDW26 TaxID=2652722 RepID=UPI001261C3EB|nr:hypothetical protein [Amylibacter sp. SFDW26]KAB7610247.1 hypothetical protein F9L33_13110 [Amylibacter sp. SFDW26]